MNTLYGEPINSRIICKSLFFYPLKLDFLPYQLFESEHSLQDSLLFIGTTYYDGYNVYEHAYETKSFLGFKIHKAELYFSNQNLIGVSLFLDNTVAYMNDVKDCMQVYFNENASDIQNTILQSVGSLIYSWEDDNYVVGLVSNIENGKLFIHVIVKEYRLLW